MAKKKHDDLEALRLPELQAKFAEVTGKETKSPNKKYLVNAIAGALAEGDAEPATEAIPGNEAPPEAEGVETGERLSDLDVPALRARVLELTGRGTRSSNKRYLLFRVQQAMKGRIPVGPRRGAGGEAVPCKVLPFRIPVAAVEALDEARRRLGLRSRNDLFRQALHAYLDSTGEHTVAQLLAPEA